MLHSALPSPFLLAAWKLTWWSWRAGLVECVGHFLLMHLCFDKCIFPVVSQTLRGMCAAECVRPAEGNSLDRSRSHFSRYNWPRTSNASPYSIKKISLIWCLNIVGWWMWTRFDHHRLFFFCCCAVYCAPSVCEEDVKKTDPKSIIRIGVCLVHVNKKLWYFLSQDHKICCLLIATLYCHVWALNDAAEHQRITVVIFIRILFNVPLSNICSLSNDGEGDRATVSSSCWWPSLISHFCSIRR